MPNGKRSHKAQMRELCRSNRLRHATVSCDESYESESDEADCEPPECEEVGRSAKRQRAASRLRSSRERLRGLDKQAQVMAAFLASAVPTAGTVEEAAKAARVEAAAEAERLAALAEAEAEREAQKAQRAASDQARYAKRKAESEAATPRVIVPRLGRTFSGSGAAPARSARRRSPAASGMSPASSSKKRKRVTVITSHVAKVIQRISHPKKRRFEKGDIVDGENMSRVEWAQARQDHSELRRVYAMNLFLTKRRERVPSRLAYEEAAKSVITPNGKPVNWQTVRGWLMDFCAAGGRLRLDQRGRSSTTISFLSEPALKEQALAWLRDQMRLMRAKRVDSPPLTVLTFHAWCNATLLQPMLTANSTLKKICERTAQNWLYKLGFSHKSHTKSIYFDGHERADVVADRMERLVVLKVLEEVTVTFVGKNCEEARWPLLHPGEPPVVWVSQARASLDLAYYDRTVLTTLLIYTTLRTSPPTIRTTIASRSGLRMARGSRSSRRVADRC